MANYIRYANQGATRNQHLDPKLVSALSFLGDMGITAEVFSGGQPAKGSGLPRVGSTRHDHGNAGDMFFYRGDEKLDWSNPEHLPVYQEMVQRGRANGVTGWGAGDGYMQPGSMHVGFGSEGVWGAGGKGDNAPQWLRDAFNGATMSAAPKPASSPVLTASASPGIQMGAGPAPAAPSAAEGLIANAKASAPAAPAAAVAAAEAPKWDFAKTPIGQMLNGTFDVGKNVNAAMSSMMPGAAGATAAAGPAMAMGGNPFGMILGALGGMGGQQESAPPPMAPPPPAHIPQVDPTALLRFTKRNKA